MHRLRILACLALIGSLELSPPEVLAQTCETRSDTPTDPALSRVPITCDVHRAQRMVVVNADGTTTSTNPTGGTANAAAPTLSEGGFYGFFLTLAGALRVTLADLISGEDQANDLLKVAPQARSLGGATTLRYISVGTTEDEHAICTAACTLYSVTVTNTNAAARYLKCENDTAANTAPGTDVPELDLAVPGATTGAGITFAFPVGAAFDTGLTCWLVTGTAESDVAEVAANELKAFYTFKQ